MFVLVAVRKIRWENERRQTERSDGEECHRVTEIGAGSDTYIHTYMHTYIYKYIHTYIHI